MEQVHIGPYHLINDVAMNAASYDTVLNTVADLSYPHIVVVNAIRGHRGPEINAQAAHILAHWNQHLHFAPLIVTLSDDALSRLPTDMRVSPEELTAFLEVAKAEHLTCQVYRELDEAIAAAIDRLAPDSALRLLGTFGMDDGPHLAANLLATRAGLSPPALLYHHIEP
jgi:UDP-N-acetylmuramoyl-L-alanyl-D-glutamate--2,6-diaminopimelate ligase